jgi:hypothetical protein
MPACGYCALPASDECPRRGRVAIDYSYWWISNPSVAPLVTTGNPLDPFPGALGQPGTQVLFGGRAPDLGGASGLRLTADFFPRGEERGGIEISGFVLEQSKARFNAGSDGAGNPPLYLPLYRPDLGREGAFAISSPFILNPLAQTGVQLGNISVANTSQLWGAEANLIRNLRRDPNLAIDVMIGFRYLDLTERLRLDGIGLVDTDTGVQSRFNDSFDVRNQFYGGQIGARFEYRMQRLSLEGVAKVALGGNQDVSNISGYFSQTGAVLGTRQGVFPGGIYTQASNIGRLENDLFAVVPQFQLKLGYDVTPWLRATLGYDFLYWSRVARAVSQLDHSVNITQSTPLDPSGAGVLVGPAAPARGISNSDLTAHGLNVGLEFRY